LLDSLLQETLKKKLSQSSGDMDPNDLLRNMLRGFFGFPRHQKDGFLSDHFSFNDGHNRGAGDDEDGDGWIDQDEFEVGEFAEEIAADLFDVCDADFDGVCTVDEAWDVIDAFDPEDEFEAELSYMTEVIFDNADNWHYWDVKEADGEITFDELATEVQWGLDHNDLEEWLEDANDGEFDYEWMGDWELDWPDCEWDDDACWEEWEA